ncbi:MAG: hypothetical protein JXB07_13165 [Anaerolineae bacterium]|nr:hypothetical protein [Anaerolineae bacterium]
MSSNKIRQILCGAICLLMVGCASTPSADTPPTANGPPSTGTSFASTAEIATLRAAAIATIEANWNSTAQIPSDTPTVTPTAWLDVPLSESGPWLVPSITATSIYGRSMTTVLG